MECPFRTSIFSRYQKYLFHKIFPSSHVPFLIMQNPPKTKQQSWNKELVDPNLYSRVQMRLEKLEEGTLLDVTTLQCKAEALWN